MIPRQDSMAAPLTESGKDFVIVSDIERFKKFVLYFWVNQ